MGYKRRDFLQLSTALLSGAALHSVTGGLKGCSPANRLGTNVKPFGIQLYTLRDDMPKDPKGILQQLASFGYKQIESYEHDKLGMFWGMKNTDFKSYLDSLGMKLIASHTDINKDFERKAREAAEIGMEYLVCPWIGPQKNLDAFKKAAQTFNERGEICKKNGLKFAYHNHDYSFEMLEGQFPQEVMMNNTDPELVDYEMDIYWVVTAGEDPVRWFNKYPNRFRLAHVKDRTKGIPLSDKFNSTTLGTGSIDYPKILREAKEKGLVYSIVEQERYDGTTPLKAVKDGARFMQQAKM